MKILIIGSGGREHAIAWKTAQSPLVQTVWVAPGNAGTAKEDKIKNINIAVDDPQALKKFAQAEKIDLTIVGPETSLAAGVADVFNEAQLLCFGPTQKAAQLETSKIFCKQFLARYHIPTAAFETFRVSESAKAFLKTQKFPIVIKADGLAAGKGVVIAHNYQEAAQAVEDLLAVNGSIIIEEFLAGEELSFIVITDGYHAIPLACARDHKRRDNGNQGPNTGGMGAYSAAGLLSEELQREIMQNIIEPTLQGMRNEGLPYLGFLYAGLMITPDGKPKLLEYNCRLGDPETQAILLRLQSDLVNLCLQTLEGTLAEIKLNWDARASLTVILAAAGYPGEYKKGNVIKGLDQCDEACKIFHAGTALAQDQFVTNGGRVLAVSALGKSVTELQEKVYQTAEKITWPGRFYRTDIGSYE